MRFLSGWGGGGGACRQAGTVPSCVSVNCMLLPLILSLWPWTVPHTHVINWGDRLQISGMPFLCRSLFCFSVNWTLATLLSADSLLCVLHSGSPWALSGHPSRIMAWKLPQRVNWGSRGALHFPSVRIFCCLMSSVSQTTVFIHVDHFWIVFWGGIINSVPCSTSGFWVFLTHPHHSLSPSLYSSPSRYFDLDLHFPCPCPGISHFSSKSC